MEFRVGLGQDSHAFSDESTRPLMLGGVLFNENLHVVSHSDGDVVMHALTNALFSAVGMRSIGVYYPNTDPRVKDAEGKVFVEGALAAMKKAGFSVANVSIAIECKTPKLMKGDRDILMRNNIAKVLGVAQDCVGVTATTGEELTPFGKGEGIQVFCTVLLSKG